MAAVTVVAGRSDVDEQRIGGLRRGERLETAAEDPRLRMVLSEGGRRTLPGEHWAAPGPGALQKPLSNLLPRTLEPAVLFNRGPPPA